MSHHLSCHPVEEAVTQGQYCSSHPLAAATQEQRCPMAVGGADMRLHCSSHLQMLSCHPVPAAVTQGQHCSTHLLTQEQCCFVAVGGADMSLHCSSRLLEMSCRRVLAVTQGQYRRSSLLVSTAAAISA